MIKKVVPNWVKVIQIEHFNHVYIDFKTSIYFEFNIFNEYKIEHLKLPSNSSHNSLRNNNNYLCIIQAKRSLKKSQCCFTILFIL